MNFEQDLKFDTVCNGYLQSKCITDMCVFIATFISDSVMQVYLLTIYINKMDHCGCHDPSLRSPVLCFCLFMSSLTCSVPVSLGASQITYLCAVR